MFSVIRNKNPMGDVNRRAEHLARPARAVGPVPSRAAGLPPSVAAAAVPLSTLRGYEQGQRIPGFGAIVRLARSLGLDCRVFAECTDIGADVTPPAKAKRKK